MFFDGTIVHFSFGIPVGATGADGTGGRQGPQGPPGEVTNAALATAISAALVTAGHDAAANSSANTNAMTTLDTPFPNDPPTLADLETLRAKLNELILALRR